MSALREAAAATSVESSMALFAKLSPGPGRQPAEVATHQCARLHSAMVEAAAARGYGAVTVRELARLAGVSTRTFYQHYASKEECFLRTHELVSRRLIRSTLPAQVGEFESDARLRLILSAFVEELERDPAAARFALIEPYAVGPAAIAKLRRMYRMLEVRIGEGIEPGPNAIGPSPWLVRSIVAGIVGIVRSRLLAQRKNDWFSIDMGLSEWVLSFDSQSASSVSELGFESRYPQVHDQPASAMLGGKDRNRALILSAVAKLVTERGYEDLTAREIRAAAGTSQRCFNANFSSVEDCFVEAFSLYADDAVAEATVAFSSASSWEQGVCRAILFLCERVASDSVFASICFDKVFVAGVAASRARESVTANVVERLRKSIDVSDGDDLSLEASIAAIWDTIHHDVVAGMAGRTPHSASALAYLMLAPLVGPEEALISIRAELETASRDHLALANRSTSPDRDRKHWDQKIAELALSRNPRPGLGTKVPAHTLKLITNRN